MKKQKDGAEHLIGQKTIRTTLLSSLLSEWNFISKLNFNLLLAMRRLFISAIVILGFVANHNAWANGGLRAGGKSLTEQNRSNDLKSYIESICGGTLNGTSVTFTNSKTPSNNVGDVYFVGINHYWKGVNDSPYNAYTQINEGVDKIEKVNDDCKQTTSSGTFYTHEAKNANKFFFISRRDNRGLGTSFNLAFQWYDEWSYVENTSNGYDQLTACYAKLKDGAPFFSPHNCDTSLETNHYISLNDPNVDDEDSMKGYNFTAFLYIPKYVNTENYAKNIATGEYTYTEKTIYVYSNYNSSAQLGKFYVKNSDGTYTEKYFCYTTTNNKKGTKTTVYTRTETTVSVPANTVPYVFFYTVNLNGTRSEKRASASQFDCPYDVNLNWTSAFDKYNSQLASTKYDGMKEHYILERSYDKINWETIEGIADIEGNDMASSSAKTYTDSNLKDFDETTTKIGYTVYYRLTSVIKKSNGTEMARRTAPEIVTVNIPGSSPFSLTIKEDSKSTYNPGVVNTDGEYTEGKNVFTNTIIAAETDNHDDVILATGAKLELIRKDTNTDIATVVNSYTVTNASMTLAELASKIGVNGVFSESVNLHPGISTDCSYQLRLKIGSDVIYSNIVDIVGSKVSNQTVGIHRSGTPDSETCADTELFHNEVSFTPANTGIGTGYYIYCNGEKVMTLVDGGNRKFTDENGKEYTEDALGNITVVHYSEADPIAVGENGNCEPAFFSYSVVHFDDLGNTYGSEAIDAQYTGSNDELVINIPSKTSKLGTSYNLAFIRPLINWEIQQTTTDVAQPIAYQIWRKVEKAEFELNNEQNSGATGNVNEDALGTFEMVAEVESNVSQFSDDIYYARRKQTTSWTSQIAEDEIRPVSYYIKAIYSDDSNVAQNEKEKNSYVIAVQASEGGVFTAIDDVQAEGISVEVRDNHIIVTGIEGTINVYNAAGQLAATAQGNGNATEIDATGFNGVYVVKAHNMTSTKILIK